MDYPDSISENEKLRLVLEFEENLTPQICATVADTSIESIGQTALSAYGDRLRSKLSSLPQEIRLILRQESTPTIFQSVQDVSEFLRQPTWTMDDPTATYIYQVTYSDGSEFEHISNSLSDLKRIHSQVIRLAQHISRL